MALTEFKLTRLIRDQIEDILGVDREAAARAAKAIVHDINIAMDFSEEGIDQRPLRIEKEAPPPTLPPPPSAISSVVPRLVALPGDKDFSPTETVVESGRKVIKPLAISRVGGRPRNPNIPERQHWSPETLIRAVEQATPHEITFVPKGMAPDQIITAVRNIVNQSGLGTVNLQYAHPRASEDLGSLAGTIKIPLVAKVTFNVYQQELDIDAALDSIRDQLRGLYAPRPKQMNPVLEDPGPLRIENAAETDTEDSRRPANWAPTGEVAALNQPFALKDGTVVTQVANAKPEVMERIRQNNRANSPLKPR